MSKVGKSKRCEILNTTLYVLTRLYTAGCNPLKLQQYQQYVSDLAHGKLILPANSEGVELTQLKL